MKLRLVWYNSRELMLLARMCADELCVRAPAKFAHTTAKRERARKHD